MKETRYFYVPDAGLSSELPADEATHAIRVLRLKEGDEIEVKLIDIDQKTGKFKLSRKVLLPKPEKTEKKKN